VGEKLSIFEGASSKKFEKLLRIGFGTEVQFPPPPSAIFTEREPYLDD
jgi:hypothetical protein